VNLVQTMGAGQSLVGRHVRDDARSSATLDNIEAMSSRLEVRPYCCTAVVLVCPKKEMRRD
jgi:hypothetical protein